MRNEKLDHVMRAEDVRDAPKHHRLMTPECPKIPRLIQAWRDGSLNESESKHVVKCEYCKFIGWMIERYPEIVDWFDLVLHILHAYPKKWSEEEVLEMAYDPSHLDTEQLFGYCENKLDDDARQVAEAHILRCDYCRHQVCEWARLLPPPHPQHSELVRFASGELDQDTREWVEEHLAVPCAECKDVIDALSVS